MAQAALARFVGSPSIPHGNWAVINTVAGQHLRSVIPGMGIFEVDANSYQVTEAVFDNRAMADDGGKTVSVSLTIAQETAAQFGAQHLARFSTLASREGRLLDHGAFKEYSFTWQARDGLAWLPTFVHVSINPGTGAVSSYSFQSVPVKVTTTPTISSDQAKSAALTAAHLNGQASVTSETLSVILEPGGAQKLAWVYELSVVHPGTYVGLASGNHVVEVDALTGAAHEVAS